MASMWYAPANQPTGADDVVRGYKSLTMVEHLFLTLKGLDLCIRPISHHEERRAFELLETYPMM